MERIRIVLLSRNCAGNSAARVSSTFVITPFHRRPCASKNAARLTSKTFPLFIIFPRHLFGRLKLRTHTANCKEQNLFAVKVQPRVTTRRIEPNIFEYTRQFMAAQSNQNYVTILRRNKISRKPRHNAPAVWNACEGFCQNWRRISTTVPIITLSTIVGQ